MRAQLGRLFKATIIAAFLVQSAAIDTPAQRGTNRRKATRSSPPDAATISTPAPSETGTPAITPTPAKANQRETPPSPQEQTPAPAPSPAATPSAHLKSNAADAVRYSYEFKQPTFLVPYILIEHDAAGRGQISFRQNNREELFTDPLEISPAALARIAAAWEALKFLESDASYQAEKQFPHLGTMTLRQKRGTRERAAEFNWTHDEAAATLIKEYKRIGEQQLFVFDIALARQYQPSDSVKIFKRLESLIKRDELSDTAQIVPLLRDLSTDERIPLIARNQAARLLKKIEK
jgi:hypothetical protein